MASLGCQLLVEAYGCDAALLDDVEGIQRHLIDAAVAGGRRSSGTASTVFPPTASPASWSSPSRTSPSTPGPSTVTRRWTCSPAALRSTPSAAGPAPRAPALHPPARDPRGARRPGEHRGGHRAAVRAGGGAHRPPVGVGAAAVAGGRPDGRLARLGPSSWGRLLDAQDGTLAEFYTAFEGHRAAGHLTLDAGIAMLTEAGRAALGARGPRRRTTSPAPAAPGAATASPRATRAPPGSPSSSPTARPSTASTTRGRSPPRTRSCAPRSSRTAAT